jgi:general secretion pathway protein G
VVKKCLCATDEAWTFVETIVVIAIIAILAGSVGFLAYRYVDSARVAVAGTQIEGFRMALNAYYLDNGVYPGTAQGLQALWEKPVLAPLPRNWRGPYLEKKVPRDPWGGEYYYEQPGPQGLPYLIVSYGLDGVPGGSGMAADIVSYENRE